MNAKITHNGKGWTGLIENEEQYATLLNGTSSFKHEDQITKIEMPYSVFKRLLELDRSTNNIIIDTSKPKEKSHDDSISAISALTAAAAIASTLNKK